MPTQPIVGTSVYDTILPTSVGFFTSASAPDATRTMPLAECIQQGYATGKTFSWHRSEERRARGLPTLLDPTTALDGWEQELAWMEVLLLSGSSAETLSQWAHSWGRDSGFHVTLSLRCLAPMAARPDGGAARSGVADFVSPSSDSSAATHAALTGRTRNQQQQHHQRMGVAPFLIPATAAAPSAGNDGCAARNFTSYHGFYNDRMEESSELERSNLSTSDEDDDEDSIWGNGF